MKFHNCHHPNGGPCCNTSCHHCKLVVELFLKSYDQIFITHDANKQELSCIFHAVNSGLEMVEENMSLEKTYSTLIFKTKFGKKESLKSYIVLLRAGLNCNIKAIQMGWGAGAS